MSFNSLSETPLDTAVTSPTQSTSSKPIKRKRQDSEDDQEQSLPSVRPGMALIDSYTYHSVDLVEEGGHGSELADEKEKINKKRKGELEWMLGVDEAGRGPVLGPQVYGIAFCPVPYLEDLQALGFADSKTLTAESREELLKVMIEHDDDIKWAVRVMSPHDLSRGMLKRNPYNLNAQSHDATIQLIQDVVQRGYNLTQVFVDTVGPPIPYQEKLQALFPTLSFVVCSKADSLFPIVSAASIAAKVTRDKVLDDWTFLEKGWETGTAERKEEGGGERNWGSGYPSDPNTIAWIASHVDPIFGYPNIARFSWQTVKTVLTKRAVAIKWDDEPATIQKYFTPGAIVAGRDAMKPALFKDFTLTPVGEL